MSVEPRLCATAAVSRLTIAGERNEGDGLAKIAAELSADLVAVERRQPDVDEYDIRTEGTCDDDTGWAVFRDLDSLRAEVELEQGHVVAHG